MIVIVGVVVVVVGGSGIGSSGRCGNSDDSSYSSGVV